MRLRPESSLEWMAVFERPPAPPAAAQASSQSKKQIAEAEKKIADCAQSQAFAARC
jgi:hypothetical protein